jgi:multiple sugar transport system substrate-binding protein
MNMRSRAMTLALASLCLVGCKDRSQVDANTPLRFWNGFSGPDGSTMKKIVESYNQTHPSAKFDMQIIPWNTYYDKVTLGMAFGGAPDVFIMQVSRLPQYADAGALEEIGPMFNASGLKPADFVKVPFESGFWKGKQYGIPLDCWPLTLYYNKKLFREAGIDKPPTNLEEFLSAARKLTKRDASGKVTQWGFALAEIHNNLIAFMDQHGGNVIDEAGKTGTLDQPASVAAVEQVKSFFQKEKIAPSPEGANAWDAFKIGKAAMVMQGIYMIADLQAQKNLEFAAAPIPQFGPKRATWGGSHMLCIPVGLPPDRKKKAWEFIKYLSDNSLRWAAAGQCPVRVEVLNSPEFRKLEGQYQAARQLGYVQYEPQSPVIGQVGGFADAAWEAILMNNEPALPTLQAAKKRIDAVLERR